ncbi:porin [Pseudoduganella sp. FT55W]|uniref:Porin n=1 Tax=Duganella rivi TaxID=2666083 RepID=A0A7X4GNJ9_9BURK|nr:porin [Duganella rivi]MYM66693.1 porin [Duganella rivi]
MRHSCALTALLIASGACQAQNSISLYGIVDVGLRSSNGLGANNAPTADRSGAVSSGINETSRWGIRGREDLGGGWGALVRLEGGINADTGSTAKSDRLFDRQAWAGLETPYGTLAAGRQPSLLSDALISVDPLGKRDASFNPNINVAALSNTAFGTHAFGRQYGPSGYNDNFYRLDNTLKYTVTHGPWQARAAWSAGEVAGDNSAGAAHGVALAYQRPDWTVSGASMQFRSRDGLPLDAWTLGAAVRADGWQFKANAARNKAETGAGAGKQVSQRVLSAGVSREAMPGLLLTTALYSVRREASGLRDDGFDRAFVFLEKTLAPRTTAYAEADYTSWRGDAAGLTGARANDRHGSGVTLGLMQKF